MNFLIIKEVCENKVKNIFVFFFKMGLESTQDLSF